MSASPSYGERPPMQGGFRRSFTQPARQLSFHEKAGLDKSDADADILYTHPVARIISFSPPTDSIKSTSKAEIPADTDYPVDTIETLPWRSRAESLMASGTLVIEKVRGSTNFLKCQTVMHAILRNSQCWCVDGESKFVLRVRKLQYYRIEMPSTTEEDKAKVEEFKKVLPTVLRYERTPCPFIRAFTVDLPDDAITPRRKGQWKRRDSSQSNTPDTETPPLRRAKITRSWSAKNPPSAYPKTGPGYAIEDERGRSGGPSGIQRRSSLFENYRNSSPASNVRSEDGTDSDQHESEHESEVGSTPDRSRTNSPRQQMDNMRSSSRDISKDHDDQLRSSKLRLAASIDHYETLQNTANEQKLYRRTSELQPRVKTTDSQGLNSYSPESSDQHLPVEDDIPLIASKQAKQTTYHKNELKDSHQQQADLPELEPVAAVQLQENLESMDSPGSQNSETAEVAVSRVSSKSADENIVDSESISSSDTSGADNDVLVVPDSIVASSGNGTASTTMHVEPIIESRSTPELDTGSPSDSELESSSLKEDTATQHEQESKQSEDDSESSISSEDEQSQESGQEAENKVHDAVPELPSHQAAVTSEDEVPTKSDDNHQLATKMENIPVHSSLSIEPEVESLDAFAENILSPVSSEDSFHTIDETSYESLESISTPTLEPPDPFSRLPSQHKRAMSEVTITASTASDPASPDHRLSSQIDHEHAQTSSLLQSSTSDTSLPEPATSSSTAQDQEGLRQRTVTKGTRSFSPLPPASTLFTGSQIQHDSGRGHMTKAILQKFIIKPIEVVVFVVHILARIASGATVSDLLSGELFKRPEHQRRVSGFADQISGGKTQSDSEDDYGNPIRGRRKSADRRVAMALDDEDNDNLEDID